MNQKAEETTDQGQSLVEHLTELRIRIVRALYAIVIGAILCYNFSSEIFDFLRQPIAPYLPEGGLVFTAPSDKFIAHIKIAIFSGVLLSCPFWIYQIWRFVAPALYAREKKFAAGFIVTGSTLFLVGVGFAYFLVLPVAFEFLLNFGGSADKPMITISEYLSFILWMSAMFGVAFELPLVIVVLSLLGLVTQAFLRDKRRYIVVGLAIFSALITPTPDALSMLLLLGPMWVLFEISVIIVGIIDSKRNIESQTES